MKLSAHIILLLLCSASYGQQGGGDPYQPIPAGSGFPATTEVLKSWLGFDPEGTAAGTSSAMKVHELRRHVWNIFAGLTSPSTTTAPGGRGKLPIWETWYSQEEVFQAPKPGARRRKVQFEYPPDQLKTNRDEPQRTLNLASRILFNRESRDHIQQEGLYLKPRLECLRGVFETHPECANEINRIIDFPKRGSVALKTAWMRVPADACGEIPIWTGDTEFPDSFAYPPSSWRDKVYVYPPGVPSASCKGTPTVPLGQFYYFQLTEADDVAAWRAAVSSTTGSPNKNDYVVLAGLHVATREIPNWVWATFWWHNRPHEGPFAADRPNTIHGPWRNYLMDTAYDMEVPRERDGSPKITFNPYLEAGLMNGTRSNCMTCHRRAIYPSINVATLPSSGETQPTTQTVVRGREAATATYLPEFAKRLTVHFIWSLTLHTVESSITPQPAGCSCSAQ